MQVYLYYLPKSQTILAGVVYTGVTMLGKTDLVCVSFVPSLILLIDRLMLDDLSINFA